MKLIITLLCALCIVSCSTDDTIQESNIFEGNLTLNTQGEVDFIGSMGYTEITGYLSIQSSGSPITSLEPLNTLTKVDGAFLSINGTQITNFNGLQNLTSVANKLQIINNYELTSVEALSNVTSVGGVFAMNNPFLESYNGLENAQIQENGDLGLTGNSLIVDASILSSIIPTSLASVNIAEGFASCPSCPSIPVPQPLNDLSFLSNLTNVGNLNITSFQGESLQGLHNITMADYVGVGFDSNLVSLEGLSGLQTVNNIFSINSLSLITDLSGIENITVLNQLHIYDNDMLTNFCVVEDLIVNGVVENLFIQNNAYNPTEQDFLNGNCSN